MHGVLIKIPHGCQHSPLASQAALLAFWSTMECKQPAVWTTNRSLLVASRAKAFPGRPTNSDSNLPRAVQLDGGVIGCHQCITSHLECAPTYEQPTWLCPACLPSTTSIPAPTQLIIAMTNYIHAPSVTNVAPARLSSSSGVFVNSTRRRRRRRRRMGTASPDITRNSCGMEDMTSRIHPSSSSIVVGLQE